MSKFVNPDILWKVDPDDDQLKAYHKSNPKDPVTWAPQNGSQVAFLSCPIFEVLYCGNRGGGKTDALLMDFLQHVNQGYGPAWRGILLRRTYPELKDVMNKAAMWFPRIFPTAKYNKTDNQWTFPEGEVLIFAQADKHADYNKFHGHSYTWQGWEELTTWPDDKLFLGLMSLVRSTTPGIPKKVRATTNPGGVGHGWVKRRYRLPVAPGEIVTPIVHLEGQPQRLSINSSLQENKILLHSDPHYIEKIRAACSSPQQEQAWIYGSWDITSGGMFDDLWTPEHHVIVGLNPEQIPNGWYIDRSYDHGQSKPWSAGFWAQSNGELMTLPSGREIGHVRGDLFRISELYGSQPGDQPNVGRRLTSKAIAGEITEKIRDMGLMRRVNPGVADASIFDQWEPDKSVAGDMAMAGIRWLPADKSKGSRIQGWLQIRKLLEGAVPTQHEDGTQTREYPGLFVAAECHDFIRTVPTLPRCRKNPDDVDTDAEDHIADEVRYRCRAKQAKKARVLKG